MRFLLDFIFSLLPILNSTPWRSHSSELEVLLASALCTSAVYNT